jgi:outer membrane protein assembly factor BamB
VLLFLVPLLARGAAGRVKTARSSSIAPRRRARALLPVLLLVGAALAAPVVSAQSPSEEDDEQIAGESLEPDDEEEEDEGESRRDAAAAERPPALQFEAVFRVPLESSASAAPALLGERAFVPLREGRLASVDLKDGRVLWTIDMPSAHAPAAGDGLVFVPAGDRLSAVDVHGTQRWSVPVNGGFSVPPLWDAGWLLAPTAGGEVLCLRARDGAVLWTRSLGAPAAARPVIAGARTFIPLRDGRLIALDLRSGEVLWEQQLAGAPAVPLALEERLFVGAAGRRFYSLSTETGRPHWVWTSMGGAVNAGPVLDTRNVYFTAFDNVLRALDRFNGSQRWKAGLPFRPYGDPILLGDLVLVTGVGPEARAYRTSDGRLAAEFNGTSDLAAPPRVVPTTTPELATIVLVTRTRELLLLRRQSMIPVVPAIQPFGIPVQLEPPARSTN